ncbi:MAG: cell division protein FtsA [Succinivibrio sp.]
MSLKKKKVMENEPRYSENGGKKFYALDLGSQNLRLAGCYINRDGYLTLNCLTERKSSGIKSGCINNMADATESIGALISDFQSKSGEVIKELYISVPGSIIIANNSQGFATVESANGMISNKDKMAAIINAEAGVQGISSEYYRILHVSPQGYTIDAQNQVPDPVDMYGKRIQVNVHVIGGLLGNLTNVEHVLKQINPAICPKFIYEGNATSSACLNENDKDIGVVSLDFGFGSTCVTVFENKRQLLSFGIQDGGNYIISSIAKHYSCNRGVAEWLMVNFGYSSPACVPQEKLHRNIFDDVKEPPEGYPEITYEELSTVILKSLSSMFAVTFEKLDKETRSSSIGSLDIGSGVVLTGGMSKLRGIDWLLSEFLRQNCSHENNNQFKCSPKVRIGATRGVSQVVEGALPRGVSLLSPEYATVLGLIRAGQIDTIRHDNENTEKNNSLTGKFRNLMAAIMREV